MSLELLKGYFYNADGNLIIWYEGYGDLNNMDDLLQYRFPSVGFVKTKFVDSSLYKYDFENNAVVVR